MIFSETNTAFRWYDSLDKQNRYKEYCENLCDFTLINPCNDLLPFQIKYDSFGVPQSWTLNYLDGTITIPKVKASSVFCIPANATSYSISVNLVGVVGTSVWLGDINSTAIALANSINSGATYTAFAHNGCVYLFAPFGEVYNGIITQLGIVYPFFSISSDSVFSGASDSTTGTSVDITNCIPFLNSYGADGNNYIQYNGGDLPGCLSQQMVCGKWYSTMSDGATTLYSEVFDVMPIEDIVFVQSKLPLFSLWRWYDQKQKQTRYKEYCEFLCNYYLLTATTELLPFQISTSAGTTGIQSWKLVGIDEDCEYLLDTSLVTIVTTASHGKRIIYTGSAMTLPCGKFYSVLNDGVTTWYSELIEITSSVSDAESNYLLQETGFKILQETSDGILLEQ